MKPLLALVILPLVVACEHTPTVPTEVKVPVPIPCKVEQPVEPTYQFHTLTAEDSIWTKVQVLLSDRQLAIAYQTELKAALAACR